MVRTLTRRTRAGEHVAGRLASLAVRPEREGSGRDDAAEVCESPSATRPLYLPIRLVLPLPLKLPTCPPSALSPGYLSTIHCLANWLARWSNRPAHRGRLYVRLGWFTRCLLAARISGLPARFLVIPLPMVRLRSRALVQLPASFLVLCALGLLSG
jgi:hypothetical protein